MSAFVVLIELGVWVNDIAAADLPKSDNLMSPVVPGEVIVMRDFGFESLGDGSLDLNEFACVRIGLAGNPETPVSLKEASVEDNEVHCSAHGFCRTSRR